MIVFSEFSWPSAVPPARRCSRPGAVDDPRRVAGTPSARVGAGGRHESPPSTPPPASCRRPGRRPRRRPAGRDRGTDLLGQLHDEQVALVGEVVGRQAALVRALDRLVEVGDRVARPRSRRRRRRRGSSRVCVHCEPSEAWLKWMPADQGLAALEHLAAGGRGPAAGWPRRPSRPRCRPAGSGCRCRPARGRPAGPARRCRSRRSGARCWRARCARGPPGTRRGCG